MTLVLRGSSTNLRSQAEQARTELPTMTRTTTASVGTLDTLIPSWLGSLRAAKKAPKTIATYREAAEQFLAFLTEAGMPTDVDKIRRERVESYVEHLLATRRPATASNRYRALARLFLYLSEEGEITASPMANMKPPTVPEDLVPVVTDDQLRAILATCKGRDFDDVRDAAILRLFIDTGLRLSELTNLKVDDLDLELDVAIVMGKGRRPRSVPFGSKTAPAIDRYLRARGKHQAASDDRVRYPAGGPYPRRGCWCRPPASSPATTHVRSHLARGGRQ
jgi:site-specific recombinase XerD